MSPPPFTEGGDLPPGVHRATLRETLERFGVASVRRKVIALRLERIDQLARDTGQLARLVVRLVRHGQARTQYVDVFLLMEDTFDASLLTGEARLLFEHAASRAHFGASVFWMRRLSALGGEQEAVEFWQIRRDGGPRGIIEIIPESP